MSDVEGEQHASKPDWKYCAIGNIAETHLDEEGMLRRGTKAFAPGTKVYLYGKYWHASDTDITVIGLNRFGHYALETVPVEWIENVRLSKVYRQTVLNIMYNWESDDCWWGHFKRDKKDVERFIALWNQRKPVR